MNTQLKPTCCANVYTHGIWRGELCGKTAQFDRDGSHYCGTHDPVARKAKDDAKRAIYNAEQDAKEKARAEIKAAQAELVRRAGCFDELLEALKALYQDYKDLANSSNDEPWYAEDQPCGIKALKAIANANGETA